MEATALGLGTPPGQQQFQIVLVAHTNRKPSKVGDVVTPPRPWMISEPLFRGFSQLDLPRQSFVGHSGHMTEPTYLCTISSEEKWFHI